MRVVVIARAGRARSAHSSASSSLSPVATPPSYWHCCCGLRFFWHWPGRHSGKEKTGRLIPQQPEMLCGESLLGQPASQPAIGRKHYKNQRTTPTHRTHTHTHTISLTTFSSTGNRKSSWNQQPLALARIRSSLV